MNLQPKTYNLKPQKGFTLIEAVVASSVFVFVVASILGVYLMTIRLDGRTRAERSVQENARFILDFLAKEVRNGSINYAAYPGGNGNNTQDNLWLINQASENERFYLSGTDLKFEKGGSTTNISSSGVKVTYLRLLVSPALNPLTSAKLANQQPGVTVIMELVSNFGEKPQDASTLNIESTFASREYPSREP